MEKYLHYDEETRLLRNETELDEYLHFRKENDMWYELPIQNVSVVGVENIPIMVSALCQQEGIDYSESNVECIQNNGIFLSFEVNGERKIFPTRGLAFNSICERAGISGPTISGFVKTKRRNVLSILDKAAWLCKGMSLDQRDCKILLRDDKISAMLSEDYVILPADELVTAVKAEMCMEYPAFQFMDASVSHEAIHTRWLINDEIADGGFQMLLKNIGYADADDIHCGLGFATSDVGLSSAYVYPFFKIKGVAVRFGTSIAVKHDGKSSVNIFRDKIKEVDTLFKEAEDQIEKLGNTDINSISSVIRKIAEENKSLFPKAQTEQVVGQLVDDTGTAMDVYVALTEITNEYCASKGFNPGLQLTVMDRVSKYLYFDYQKYDV